jgi:hypothetical protein
MSSSSTTTSSNSDSDTDSNEEVDIEEETEIPQLTMSDVPVVTKETSIGFQKWPELETLMLTRIHARHDTIPSQKCLDVWMTDAGVPLYNELTPKDARYYKPSEDMGRACIKELLHMKSKERLDPQIYSRIREMVRVILRFVWEANISPRNDVLPLEDNWKNLIGCYPTMHNWSRICRVYEMCKHADSVLNKSKLNFRQAHDPVDVLLPDELDSRPKKKQKKK